MIKSPLTLLQKEVEILFGNAIKSAHISLGLIPKILNAIDMIMLVCKQLTMIDSIVLEIGHIKDVVAGECIGIDDAVRRNMLLLYNLESRKVTVELGDEDMLERFSSEE